ncbi:MAG: BlaI/MecI/CopY family transcriptional regulator [Halobacteriales archaeon]|nr:BlaI/MecI/CopY family transcriptional regulator [Halobacteriales archaeon]
MSPITWNDLGPREKQLLAILRRADEPLASRDVLAALRGKGDDVAYTTVSTILDRLVEKGIVSREEETVSGSMRFRYSFDPTDHRRTLVDSVVDDVADVLDGPGLVLLAERAEAIRVDEDQSTDS